MLKRWNQPNGYRQLLAIGLPLVVSMGSQTFMLFTDRVFLAGYSLESIAAALPAGITAFLFVSFFLGVTSYVNVFVAQYTGAGQPEKVAASLWQGIYFSLMAGAAMAVLYFLAPALFAWGGHPPEVQKLEVVYFRILMIHAVPFLCGNVLSTFFSGRGLTRPVMLINVLGAALNIPLDYALINGFWFIPPLGIVGAGLATLFASITIPLGFVLAIKLPQSHRKFRLWANRGFKPELFKRMMRFGLPGGVQFFLDIFAITFFVFMVGRLGTVELAATNIAFSIDTLAFLPMTGFHVAVQTLVGQAIGKGRPEQGREATTSALHLTMLYMAVVAIIFLALPDWLMELFRTRGFSDQQFAPIKDTGVVLIRFVALYTVLDSLCITYAGGLKGAGDTKFVMSSMGLLSVLFLMLPVYIGIVHLGWGLYPVWAMISVYVLALSLTFWLRFRGGKWMSMRVI